MSGDAEFPLPGKAQPRPSLARQLAAARSITADTAEIIGMIETSAQHRRGHQPGWRSLQS
jgi:hypothetical protein